MEKTNRNVKFPRLFAAILVAATLVATALLAGCSKADAKKDELKIGVCPGPYGDMFVEAIKPSLEKKGYTVTIVEFSDYVQPNKALAAGEISANMFQHTVYLKKFSADNGLDLTYITEIPTAGMGVFSATIKSLDAIPDGATVAIPNDATNLSRSIRVLEQTGLVKIKADVQPSVATQNDLSENPKNLKFVEIEAPQLPRSLDSVDIAVVNGNYALSAGLKLADALYNEKIAEGYVNCIAVRTADKDAKFAKDIASIVKSDDFRKVIEDPTKQYISFHRPKDY